MARCPDWPERLFAIVDRYRAKAFRYGNADCSILAADCARAICGRDPLRDHRRAYKDLKSGIAWMRKNGFETIADAFAERLEEIPPALAQRGDLVFFKPDEIGAMGVVVGDRAATMNPQDGLVLADRRDAVRAFRVN